MGSVVLICPEPVRKVVQGIGIRFLELATELVADHSVFLWVPNHDIPEEMPCQIMPFPDHQFSNHLHGADVVIIHGHISDRYFDALERDNLGTGPPLVVDLYDPFLIENLHYTDILGDEIYYRDRKVLFRQLARGDFFLVSSDAQRLYYLGILTGMCRLSPQNYHQDSTLRSFIDVAPFGIRAINEKVLANLPGKLKGVVPGIEPDDLVLFFGGVYDWYDPALLLDVLDEVFKKIPKLRVIFSINPNQATTPQGKFREIQTFSKTKGWTGNHLFFIPWFAYKDRFAYLRDVDLALCLHEPSLETDLSFRTRILDYMNLGIPIISTEGGEGSRILKLADAGILIPPGAEVILKETLIRLLSNRDERVAIGKKGQQWARRQMTWEKSLVPLKAFCDNPRRMPHGQNDCCPISIVAKSTVKKLRWYWRQNGTSELLRAIVRYLKRGF